MPKGREGEYATKKELNRLQKEVDDNIFRVYKYANETSGDVVDLDKRLRIQEKLKKLDGKKGPVKFKKASTKLKPTRSKAKKKAVLKKPAKSRSKSWWEY